MSEAIGNFMDPFTPEGDFMGMKWSAGNKSMQSAQKATAENEKNAPILAAAAAAEKKRIEDEAANKNATRLALQNAPSSGFATGANTARQFLTSF